MCSKWLIYRIKKLHFRIKQKTITAKKEQQQQQHPKKKKKHVFFSKTKILTFSFFFFFFSSFSFQTSSLCWNKEKRKENKKTPTIKPLR